MDNSESIDYDKIEKMCHLYKPVLIIGGASSYPQQINYIHLSKIAKKHNALLLADISHTALFIATGHHMSPFGYADFVTMTTNKTTRGARGGIVFYKKKFTKVIQQSIFPLTQGSPKYNEILSKIVMFLELENIGAESYANKILNLSSILADSLMKKGHKIYTNSSNSHLVVIDLRDTGISGLEAEKKLNKVNILANRNSIPNDKRSAFETSGIRLGTLSLATLDITLSDFKRIVDIIIDTIYNDNPIHQNEIISIMSNYSLSN